jgi:hypothetical protein
MIGLFAVALGIMLLLGVPLPGIGIFVLICGVLALTLR